MPRTWVFQANPDRFDIDGFLATRPATYTFLVTRYRQEIGVGDQVFIWRSIGGGNQDAAGVIAEGEVIELPAVRPDEADARSFWANPSDADVPAERLILRLVRIADSREIIRRRWIQEDPVLREMLILRQASATNYDIPDAQAARLNALWSRTGRDWSYADSLAGLWAYRQTYGREVSRLSGSPVADTALLIGRAVSGVYNKVMNFRSIDPRDQRTGMTGGGAMDRRVWSDFYDQRTQTLSDQQLSAEFSRLWGETESAIPLEDAGRLEATIDAEARRLCALGLHALMDRYRAISRTPSPKPAAKVATTRQFARDPLVVAIAKVRAAFRYEVLHCQHPMFADTSDMPYCEVHHIRPLAEGGQDDLDNVACLCAAHHREVRHGKAAKVIRAGLVKVRTTGTYNLQNEMRLIPMDAAVRSPDEVGM